jgi:hypothetical protein
MPRQIRRRAAEGKLDFDDWGAPGRMGITPAEKNWIATGRLRRPSR